MPTEVGSYGTFFNDIFTVNYIIANSFGTIYVVTLNSGERGVVTLNTLVTDYPCSAGPE